MSQVSIPWPSRVILQGHSDLLLYWNRGAQAIKTADFDFYLPEELIAQTPLERRDASRLLVLDKETGATRHMHFFDLPTLLGPGDCLVLNDSRVLPARLLGHREPTGGAVEVLLLIDRGDKVWECLVRPGRKLKPGTRLSFGDGSLKAEVVEVCEGGNRLVRFEYEGIFLETLERLDKMPCRHTSGGAERIDGAVPDCLLPQRFGSAAAPTAGLHFTRALLPDRKTGVKVCYVTLHVGLGTFRPVKEEEITDHEMHSEYCMISAETAETINRTKREGGPVICVGTTSCRTIESWAAEDGTLKECAGWTNIFIYPGYQFGRCLTAFITNPSAGVTLIMYGIRLAGRACPGRL